MAGEGAGEGAGQPRAQRTSDFLRILRAYQCPLSKCCVTQTLPKVPVPTVVETERSSRVKTRRSFRTNPWGQRPCPTNGLPPPTELPGAPTAAAPSALPPPPFWWPPLLAKVLALLLPWLLLLLLLLLVTAPELRMLLALVGAAAPLPTPDSATPPLPLPEELASSLDPLVAALPSLAPGAPLVSVPPARSATPGSCPGGGRVPTAPSLPPPPPKRRKPA